MTQQGDSPLACSHSRRTELYHIVWYVHDIQQQFEPRGYVSDVLPPLPRACASVYLQDSHLFVAVADGGGDEPIQPKVVDMGEAGLVNGRWHALVISHRRSSTLLFNKDQMEASTLSLAQGREINRWPSYFWPCSIQQ